LEIN
jgi:coatomer subunit beta